MAKSNKNWLHEHHSDSYVKKAQREGYPSRAAYKLLELHERDHLLRPRMRVVDLGAAPGSWLKIASKLVGPEGQVLGIDLLPLQIDLSLNMTFIQGDFNDDAVRGQLQQALGHKLVDAVISDLAPNISGNKSIDQPRSMQLVEMAWYFAAPVLTKGGFFLVKIFQGADVQTFAQSLRPYFKSIKWRKPAASRARSAEVYLLAQGYKGVAQTPSE